MYDEVEIVRHPYIGYVNIFIVKLEYRNSHMHHDFELDLVLAGETKLMAQNRMVELIKGDMIILNPNDAHEIKAGKDGAIILCIQLSPKFLHSAFPNMGHLLFDEMDIKRGLTSEAITNMRQLFIELSYQYFLRRPAWQLLCSGLINMLLYHLLRYLPHHILSEDEQQSIKRRAERLRRSMSYVEENYMHRLLLSDIAKREGLSLGYLSHFLRDNLNLSFQDYVSSIRLQHAKTHLLSADSKRMLDISLEAGFSDPRYMKKAFLRFEGCTPEQYRNRHNVNNINHVEQTSAAAEQFFSLEASLKFLRPLREPIGTFLQGQLNDIEAIGFGMV